MTSQKPYHLVPALLVMAVFLASNSAFGQSRISKVIPAMGTQARIIAYAENEVEGGKAVDEALNRVLEIEDRLSDYDLTSEAMLFCKSAPHETLQPISEDLWICLLRGKQIWSKSKGAFDVTVGAYSKLWRRARRQREFPSKERLSSAALAVGFENVDVDVNSPRAAISTDGLQLDFGAIAKGYAADEAIRVLKELGINSAIADVGGDVSIGTAPSGKPGWPVGIAPLSVTEGLQITHLSQCGVATSGDAFQFVELDGRRYSHIIDPRTGIALTLRSSVTVVAPTGLEADAWASAISVLGPRVGLRMIRRLPGVTAYVVTDRNEDGIGEISQSRGFPQLADELSP
ncbi:MAG: FAD:protein FMN transferase [Pirellulaceae bacterium]